MATSRLLPDWASIRKADDAKYAEAFARIGTFISLSVLQPVL